MDEYKPIKTPMPTNGHLNLDEGGNTVDQTLYRSMIGSLLYLTVCRPDIMFSVCMCARFQANPKETHLITVKESLGICRCFAIDRLPRGYLGQFVRASANAELDG